MSLKISRILHAGYVFEYKGVQIAFDPIFENPFSRNCQAFPAVEFDLEQVRKLRWDAVFISHFHDDHCSLESLNLLDRETPIYLYCLHDEMFGYIKELGFDQVFSLKLNEVVRIGEVEVIPRRALDEDVDSLFHIKAGELNVLNVVDSWIDYETVDELARLASWDVVLWPFQTMREIEVLAPSRAPRADLEIPSEWKEQLKTLNPRYVVPSSCQFIHEEWSWYRYQFFPISYRQFQKQVQELLPDSGIVRMNPGGSIFLNKNSVKLTERLEWVRPLGEQNVDYEFDQERTIPSTADIAQKFAALSLPQSLRVQDYCEREILKKYSSLEVSQGSYFEGERIWLLSLYDHQGLAKEFCYRLQGASIVRIPVVARRFSSWTTDVPIAKLFAALEMGESLSSMYVRVNDVAFVPEVEALVAQADVMEDPLIRCLFTGVFGSYQLAQLKTLGLR